MVTIQVFTQSTGKPVKGSRVGISIGNDGVAHEYTDGNGEANFSNVSPRDAEVYVDGKTLFKGRLEGHKILYI